MKNKYKQHLNSFTLTQEVKEEVKEAVEHYNRKKLSNKRKVVLVTSMAIIVGIALLNASDVFNDNKRHSFVIKADEDVYIIEKSELRIQQSKVINYTCIEWDSRNKTVSIDPIIAPLNITIEGEGIETITYTVEGNASIQKLIKVNKEILDFPAEVLTHDIIPPGTLCNAEAERCWEIRQPSLSEGVTIAYDKQNDDHYLYGIALTAKASELFVNTTSAENSEQRDEELKKVIKKAFSEVAINVRVNYVDGSVETQKLVFNTDDLGIPVLNK